MHTTVENPCQQQRKNHSQASHIFFATQTIDSRSGVKRVLQLILGLRQFVDGLFEIGVVWIELEA